MNTIGIRWPKKIKSCNNLNLNEVSIVITNEKEIVKEEDILLL